MCCGLLIGSYEVHYRGPSGSAFVGTWEADWFSSDDECIYVEFRSDQTFSLSSSPTMDEEFITGRWYAGGPNLYIRFNPHWSGEVYRTLVWRIIDIQPDEFRVRIRDANVKVCRRVHAATPRI